MAEQRLLNDTYVLMEEIGSGGSGVVYKAYHTRLKIYVVVKKIKEQAKGRLSGSAEADILKNIKHTCLPRVYDIFEANGDVYTVIDFIPGESLDKVIAREGRIPQKRVLKWAVQLSEALSYLHSMNPPVIHSDIKPANIMLTPDDDICLIDFNISLALDGGMKDSVGVTGGYSPPEQYKSQSQYYKFLNSKSAAGMAEVKSEFKVCSAENADNAETENSEDGETAVSQSSSETMVSEEEDVTLLPGNDETVFSEDGETVLPADDETVLSPKSHTEQSGDKQKGREGQAKDTTETGSPIERTIGKGIDERSDIYSLGATLYHLLTGVRPGRDFEKIRPIDECGIEISEGFAHIISRMMELDPADRYQNGTELLQAFQNIHELDSEYIKRKRTQRIKKAAAAAVMAAGVILMATRLLVMRSERNSRYNELILYAGETAEDGGYETALGYLEEAQELIPGRAEAYAQEVRLMYLSGKYGECIDYAESLLANPPFSLKKDVSSICDIYYVIGNACIEAEDYGSAAGYLSAAIGFYSENSLYYRDYAIALAKTGNTGLAEETLAEAVNLGLGEDSIYMVQGEIAYAAQSYEEALTYFKKTLSCAADTDVRRRAVLFCDKTYRALGDGYIDEEISLLEDELGLYSDTSATSVISERLADAYVRKAKSDEAYAEEYYLKALDIFEELYGTGYVTSQLMENIAILYEDLDMFDESEEMLLLMAELYPDDYTAYMRLAYLEADRQQEVETAARDYSIMAAYYEKASELYDGNDADQEMQMLEIMMQELADGGWLE